MGLILGLLGRVPFLVWPLIAALTWGEVGHLEAGHWKKAENALQAKIDASAEIAAETARLQSLQIAKDQEIHDAETRTVVAARDAALRSLRNRPAQRLPEAAAPTCAGASPSALSQQDAGLAIGLAAEADQLRADYQVCRAWISTVSGGGK